MTNQVVSSDMLQVGARVFVHSRLFTEDVVGTVVGVPAPDSGGIFYRVQVDGHEGESHLYATEITAQPTEPELFYVAGHIDPFDTLEAAVEAATAKAVAHGNKYDVRKVVAVITPTVTTTVEVTRS